jgi:hypothetical protein
MLADLHVRFVAAVRDRSSAPGVSARCETPPTHTHIHRQQPGEGVQRRAMLRVALALAALLASAEGWYNEEINAKHAGTGGASVPALRSQPLIRSHVRRNTS